MTGFTRITPAQLTAALETRQPRSVKLDTLVSQSPDPTAIGAAPLSHDHDDRYYTDAQVDALIQGVSAGATAWGSIGGTLAEQLDLAAALAAKVPTDDPSLTDARTPTAHDHDARYYTEAEVDALIAAVPGGTPAFPVGSVFIAVVSTDPATLLGYGTWTTFGAGRVLVGLNAGDADFDTAEKTGGAKTHTLSTAEMPTHTHTQDAHGHLVTDPGHTHLTQRYPTATGGSSGFTIDTSMSGTPADNTLPTKAATTGISVGDATATNQSTGGGSAHNNLQPFITVFMWKRVS
jgi:microcystin-dependent protein